MLIQALIDRGIFALITALLFLRLYNICTSLSTMHQISHC